MTASASNSSPTRTSWRSWARGNGIRSWWGLPRRPSRCWENARKKLHRKNLDLLVANDVTQEGSGFDVDTNAVTLLDRDGTVTPLPVMSKADAAGRIYDWFLQYKNQSQRRGA